MTKHGKWAGVAAAALFIASMVVSAVLADGSLPLPGATGTEVSAYVSGNESVMAASAVLQAAAGLALLWFAVWLAGRLARPHAAAVLGGAASGLALHVVSAACSIVLTKPEVHLHEQILPAIQWLGFVSGGPGVVVAMSLVVAGAALGLDLPAWLRVSGVVVAVLATLALLGMVAQWATPFIPAGRFGAYLWILAAAPFLGKAARPRQDLIA